MLSDLLFTIKKGRQVTDMTKKLFEETLYGAIAMEKIGDVSENFRIYVAGWIGNGDPAKSTAMRVTGAEFRKAKKGPNKGLLSIKVPGTEKTVLVTRDELAARQNA